MISYSHFDVWINRINVGKRNEYSRKCTFTIFFIVFKALVSFEYDFYIGISILKGYLGKKLFRLIDAEHFLA